MPRNNQLVAQNRWRNYRERERLLFALPETVRVEKAALCGFLAGDGSIKKRCLKNSVRIDIKFYPDDTCMLENYIGFFSKVYGKIPTVRAMKCHYCAQITSRAIGEDILSVAVFGLRTWLPPLLETQEERIAWLRAFFSAEGYVSVSSIRVQTINEQGMRAVSALLSELGIEHGFYAYQPKRPAYARVYIVTILKRHSRMKYLELVGFWHSKKTAALAKSLDLKAPCESAEV